MKSSDARLLEIQIKVKAQFPQNKYVMFKFESVPDGGPLGGAPLGGPPDDEIQEEVSHILETQNFAETYQVGHLAVHRAVVHEELKMVHLQGRY